MNLKRKQRELDRRFSGSIKIEDKGSHYRLSGTAETWQEAVEAGLMCARSGSKMHVVNDIDVPGDPETAPVMPEISDDSIDGMTPDVMVIGGGVTGCAAARELSRYRLDVLLVDKEYDVALHASSRNDGMVHPGIDIKPGLLKKKMNNAGNAMYDRLCSDLDVPFSRCGQYLCFRSLRMLPLMFLTIPYWNLTVAGRAHVITGKKLREREPGVSDEAKCALFFDGAGTVCPYGLTIALAENAADNGVTISLDTAVTGMDVDAGRIVGVSTNRGTVRPKIVINAAGVFAEEIAQMADDRFFSIHPRKGTNAILDRKARSNINTIYSLLGTQSRSAHTKGGGIVGTVDGNVLVGPDAVEVRDREDFSTCAESIDGTFEKQGHAAGWLSEKDIITYFSGIRAATYEEDFIVEKGRHTSNIVHAAGIQSPGLTAAPAIAAELGRITAEMLSQSMKVEKDPEFDPHRRGIVRVRDLSDEERSKVIEGNRDYGNIVCRCEEISRGEILDAMRRSVPCDTVDGIKRRVRPGMGRCQGGFCGPQIVRIIAGEKHIPPERVRKGYPGSEILSGDKRGARDEKI